MGAANYIINDIVRHTNWSGIFLVVFAITVLFISKKYLDLDIKSIARFIFREMGDFMERKISYGSMNFGGVLLTFILISCSMFSEKLNEILTLVFALKGSKIEPTEPAFFVSWVSLGLLTLGSLIVVRLAAGPGRRP